MYEHLHSKIQVLIRRRGVWHWGTPTLLGIIRSEALRNVAWLEFERQNQLLISIPRRDPVLRDKLRIDTPKQAVHYMQWHSPLSTLTKTNAEGIRLVVKALGPRGWAALQRKLSSMRCARRAHRPS